MATQYLSGDRSHLLEPRFEFVDDDNSIMEDISLEELRAAEETGFLVHPDSGNEIEDYEKYVVMYFQPSSLIDRLIK